MSWFGFREARVPTHVPAPDTDRELVLYKYDSCGFCQRVLRKVAELCIDLELRDTLMEPENRRRLHEATGRTQVPCLFIDGEPLFESADIVAWLQAYAKRETA